MKKVVIYARVSTNSQDYERQIIDLRDYANRMDYVVVKEFSEKISGAKKVAEREQLSELLNYVEAHHIGVDLRMLSFEQTYCRFSASYRATYRKRDISLYPSEWFGNTTSRRKAEPNRSTCFGYDSTIQFDGKRTYQKSHGKRLSQLSCKRRHCWKKARLQEIY